MATKAIMFDLDGTLLNTLEDIADSMNQALMDNGLPVHDIDTYRYFVGNGITTLAKRACGMREDLIHAVLKAYKAYYTAGCQNKTRPYDGVMDMLTALISKGYKLCVFSNKPHQDTLDVVAHYFPNIPFRAVRGQTENVPVKPDPTGALETSKDMGIAPKDFIYVGDTGVDMDCANAAGMVPVGVLWGFRPQEELTAHNALHLIERPLDLLTLL